MELDGVYTLSQTKGKDSNTDFMVTAVKGIRL